MISKSFLFAVLFLAGGSVSKAQTLAPARIEEARAALDGLEKNAGGRVGVAFWDSRTGARLERRGDERFAFCSTFKTLLAAAVLARVEKGDEKLDRAVAFGPADLLEYAPIARQRLGDGKMTISELCAATVSYGDNTTANLLLASIGGPEKFTQYVRSLGDDIMRLDRTEPSINSNLPGDPRDTTTPHAMIESMRKILLENALSPTSRQMLVGWLVGSAVGKARLRAGFDSSWRIGDKTGSGEHGATNDVAIVWPPGGKPFLVVVFCSEATKSPSERDAVVAEVGRIIGRLVPFEPQR